jgi:hypothetical protein
MTPATTHQQDDQDIHKGAIEGDRPSDETNTDQKNGGVDQNGLPNDPLATAEDEEGANADQSQG